MIDFLASVIQRTPLLVYVMAAVFAGLAIIVLIQRRRLSCADLITSPDGRLSRTAIGQTCGIVVATWAPAYTAIEGKLDSTVLLVCLGYLGGVEGYAKYLRWKDAQNRADRNNGKSDDPDAMQRGPLGFTPK